MGAVLSPDRLDEWVIPLKAGELPTFISAEPERDGEPGPEDIVASMARAIETFRLGDVRYRELKGSDRVMPSIVSQIEHAALHLGVWVDDLFQGLLDEEAFAYAGSLSAIDSEQLGGILEIAATTENQYEYWQANYQSDEQNPSGRWVEWVTWRAVAPQVRALKERMLLARRALAGSDNLFSQASVDFSAIALDPRVRRTAYEGRLSAKVGMACLQIVTQETRPRLEGLLAYIEERGRQEQEGRGTPDLMGRLAMLQAFAQEFSFVPRVSSIAEDDMPF